MAEVKKINFSKITPEQKCLVYLLLIKDINITLNECIPNNVCVFLRAAQREMNKYLSSQGVKKPSKITWDNNTECPNMDFGKFGMTYYQAKAFYESFDYDTSMITHLFVK